MSNSSDKFGQYFVAIVPPSPIYDDTLKLKLFFEEKYKSKAALRSPPHITLHMPFRWKENKETALIEKVKTFANENEPVKVCVDNFSSFAPRVIFMNVTNNEMLDELQRRLKRFFRTELNIFNANYKEEPFHPHVTVAFRDLKKSAFKEAWEEFKTKEYKAEFIADKIALLKHDGKKWNLFKEFSLTTSYSTESEKRLASTEG